MGSPGPATLSLAGVGSAYGFSRGLRYLTGIIVGTTGVLFVVACGFVAVISAKPQLLNIIKLIALAYILFLAWKIARAPVQQSADPAQTAPSFLSGCLLAIANPKAFAAIGAVYTSHRLVPENIVADGTTKVVVLSAVIVFVNTGWIYFGAMLSSMLRNPRDARLANLVFAALLVISVGLSLLSV